MLSVIGASHMEYFWLFTAAVVLGLVQVTALLLFDHRYAIRRKQKAAPVLSEHLSAAETFRPRRSHRFNWIFVHVCLCLMTGIILSTFRHDLANPVLWFFLGLLLLVFLICIYGTIRHFRAFVRVDANSLIYQGVFKRKELTSADVDEILMGKSAIFIKPKFSCLPWIIERGVWDDKSLYRALCTLGQKAQPPSNSALGADTPPEFPLKM